MPSGLAALNGLKDLIAVKTSDSLSLASRPWRSSAGVVGIGEVSNLWDLLCSIV